MDCADTSSGFFVFWFGLCAVLCRTELLMVKLRLRTGSVCFSDDVLLNDGNTELQEINEFTIPLVNFDKIILKNIQNTLWPKVFRLRLCPLHS